MVDVNSNNTISEMSQTETGDLHETEIYDSMNQIKKLLRIYFKFMMRSAGGHLRACPELFKGSMCGPHRGHELE